jgi:hypothetical protein
MSVSDSSEPEEERSGESSVPDRGGFGKPVDPQLWTRKDPPQGLLGVAANRLGRVAGLFASPVFLIFVALPLGGSSVYLTLLLAYDFGATRLFGVYFLGIWAVIITCGIVVLEKSGYARNFERWDIPWRRFIILPIMGLVVIGIFLLIFYVIGAPALRY